MRGLRPDSPLSSALLIVWYLFVVSALLVVCAMPYLLFDLLIGWQPAHGALWLGAATLAPVGPAVFATLAACREMVLQRTYPGGPAGRFVRAWAFGARRLAWLWSGMTLVVLLLAYDIVLLGTGRAVVAAVIVCGTVVVVLGIAVSCVVLEGAHGRPAAVIARAVGAVAVRPHVALAWVFLVACTAALSAVPVVGPNLVLFSPAACAATIVVVNRAWGFGVRRAG